MGPLGIHAAIQQVFDKAELIELTGDRLARTVFLMVQIAHLQLSGRARLPSRWLSRSTRNAAKS